MIFLVLGLGGVVVVATLCAAAEVYFSGRAAIGLSCGEPSAGVTGANLGAYAPSSTTKVGGPLAAPIRRRESSGYSPAGFSFGPNRNRRRHDWLPLLFASGQIRRMA